MLVHVRRLARHRARRLVIKHGVGQVAGPDVVVGAVPPLAALHVRLDRRHHAGDRVIARRVHTLAQFVAGEGPHDAGRFVERHGEVVADAAIMVGPCGQAFARLRVEVIHHPLERDLADFPRQPELPGELSAPVADGLLTLGVVVGGRVILLGVRRGRYFADGKHGVPPTW